VGPVLAVGAVIRLEKQGKPAVVLIQRANPPAAGTWSLPGGRVVSGERLEAALVREILEETGLSIAVDRLIEVIEILGERHHYVILDYAASLIGPIAALRAGDDAADARIVALDELASYGVTEAVERVVRAAF
jgi:acetyl-CoA carboxylase carboxyl transferase subunit beta